MEDELFWSLYSSYSNDPSVQASSDVIKNNSKKDKKRRGTHTHTTPGDHCRSRSRISDETNGFDLNSILECATFFGNDSSEEDSHVTHDNSGAFFLLIKHLYPCIVISITHTHLSYLPCLKQIQYRTLSTYMHLCFDPYLTLM